MMILFDWAATLSALIFAAFLAKMGFQFSRLAPVGRERRNLMRMASGALVCCLAVAVVDAVLAGPIQLPARGMGVVTGLILVSLAALAIQHWMLTLSHRSKIRYPAPGSRTP